VELTEAFRMAAASLDTEPEDWATVALGLRICEELDKEPAAREVAALSGALLRVATSLGMNPAARAQFKPKPEPKPESPDHELASIRASRKAA